MPSSGLSLRCTAQPFKDKPLVFLTTGRIFRFVQQTVTGSASAEAGKGKERQGEASFYTEKLQRSPRCWSRWPGCTRGAPRRWSSPKRAAKLTFHAAPPCFSCGEAEALQQGFELSESGYANAVLFLHTGRKHRVLPVYTDKFLK